MGPLGLGLGACLPLAGVTWGNFLTQVALLFGKEDFLAPIQGPRAGPETEYD